MAMPIFTKGSCLRHQMYDTLITIAKNAGWVEHKRPNFNYEHSVLTSVGESGNEKLEFEIMPYDANAAAYWNSSYIIKGETSTCSRGIFRFTSSSADFSTVNVASPYYVLPFVYNNSVSANSPSSSYRLLTDANFKFNYYYFANKDVICIFFDPEAYTGIAAGTFIMIGKPSDSYLQERGAEGRITSNLMYAVSNSADGGDSYIQVADTPKVFPPSSSLGYKLSTQNLNVYLSPNVDGKFSLVDVFAGTTGEGIRGRLGHFYVTLPSSRIVSGDTVTVTTPTGTEKYIILNTNRVNNSFGSYYYVLLRIE